MKLQDFLAKNGISLAELAPHWGISLSTLSRVTSGRRFPDIEIILRAYKLSNGVVRLADWCEAYKASLPAELHPIIPELRNGEKTPRKVKRPYRKRGRKAADAHAAA